MGSNCCKGDAAGRPVVRSNSSIYTRSRAGAILDGRFRKSVDAGGVRLTVTSAQIGDSGVYTLQASNAAGKDTTRVSLEVSPDEIPTGDDPPTFLRRLQDLTVKVGTRTRFLVEILSSTECKVTWYRNERRLLEAERIALVRDGNFWCADVATVSVDDAGRWTCTAENLGGRASCSAHLNVLVPKAYKRPEFVEELRAILTEQGTVSLECKVVGVPTPVLRWFKDSREIKAGDVFALTANADDPTSLGTYTCEAINCMGRAYSSSKVHVIGRSKEGSDKPSFGAQTPDPPPIFTKELEDQFVRICDHLSLGCQIVVPPWPRSVVWYNKEGKIDASAKYHTIEDGVGGYMIEVSSTEWADEGEWKCVATSSGGRVGISTCNVTMDVPKNYRKPRFMENLQAVLTEEGLVSFECKVVGYPTPLLSWFKDGQELKPGDVYQLTGTNSLGSYCCIARNCMGQTSSSAELTVEDIQNQLNEEEKLQLFSQNQAPKFLQGLKSVEVKIDEPFRFTIKVVIPPEPTVLWYRDDQPVDESPRCHLGQEDRGVFYLDIKNLELMDQTEWKCVAMNDYGHSVTSCFLKLIIPRHYKKPRFLENLQAILSDEGAVNLECKVIGVPQPVLKWYKDGEELKPGDIHRIISGQDGTCCLGTYTCEAQNCMGIAASSASLLGFEDTVKTKKKKADDQILQRNLSLSTIHEERTSQMYDTPVADVTLDEKGEISFSFDGKEVSVSLYETPDLTEEEALQIVEMYADQLSENVTEHNVIELPPLRFVKETSTSGNLLMEAIIIDVSPEYFVLPEEDLRTEADIEDISIAEENGQAQLSFDQDVGDEYIEKTMALLSDEKADFPAKPVRRKSDSQKSGEDYFSLSKDQSLSEERKDDDTQVMSESVSFASAHSIEKQKSKLSQEDEIGTQESSDITKTVLLREEFRTSLETENKSTKVISSIRRESLKSSTSFQLGEADIVTLNENMTFIGSNLSKILNNIQTLEKDIVMQSQLLSTTAIASKSLEIISSIINPLTEIHCIIDVFKESINDSSYANPILFKNLPQCLKQLQSSLSMIEKCIDIGNDKTLINNTCISIINNCEEDITKFIEKVKEIREVYPFLFDDVVSSEIQLLTHDILNIINVSKSTVASKTALSQTNNDQELSMDKQHLNNTQKAIYNLEVPVNSLLEIIENSLSKSTLIPNVINNAEVILFNMSSSIQDLQTALEHIELLSVEESNSELEKYNTTTIETVIGSVLKLRNSFENLSCEKEKKYDKEQLHSVLQIIKIDLEEISSHIDDIGKKIGHIDVLYGDNKLEMLQKMAHILISLESYLPLLNSFPNIQKTVSTFHKSLTKALEMVIESNESTKYLTLLHICDVVNRINNSIKTFDSDKYLSLTSIGNNLIIIEDILKNESIDHSIGDEISETISQYLVDIQDIITTYADESSINMDSDHVEEISVNQMYTESKANLVVQQIDQVIAVINNISSEEVTPNLCRIIPVLQNTCPVLEELKFSIASLEQNIQESSHASDKSQSVIEQCFGNPLKSMHENVMVLNQVLLETVVEAKIKDDAISVFAKPLYELYTTLQTLQENILSQYESFSVSQDNEKIATSTKVLHDCILIVEEQCDVERVDEMSTLQDISCLKTTADAISESSLLLPESQEVVTGTPIVHSLENQPKIVDEFQLLHNDILEIQKLDILEALNTLSEVKEYANIKSVTETIEEIQHKIVGILSPLVMESLSSVSNLDFNSNNLSDISESLLKLKNHLTVIDVDNIPIYEEVLKIPSNKIHSIVRNISNLKEHLDKCLLYVQSTNAIDKNELKDLCDMCYKLKSCLETATQSDLLQDEYMLGLVDAVENFFHTLKVNPDITVEEVKVVSEDLYKHVLNINDTIIEYVSPTQAKQQRPLVETIHKLAFHLAISEHYEDISSVTNVDYPKIVFETPMVKECISETKNLITNNERTLQDLLIQHPKGLDQTELLVIQNFLEKSKNSFNVILMILSQQPTQKKIIRLFQEYFTLRCTIQQFIDQKSKLNYEVLDCLDKFLNQAKSNLERIKISLIKVSNSLSKSLFKEPLKKVNNCMESFPKYLKVEDILEFHDLIQNFLISVNIAAPHLEHLEENVVKELETSILINSDAENNLIIESLDNFMSFLERELYDKPSKEKEKILQDMMHCFKTHQDYKNAIGTGKRMIILKCLAECSDILRKSFQVFETEIERMEKTQSYLPQNSLYECLKLLKSFSCEINKAQETAELINYSPPGEIFDSSLKTIIALKKLCTKYNVDVNDTSLSEHECSLIKDIINEINSIQNNTNISQMDSSIILKNLNEIEDFFRNLLPKDEDSHDHNKLSRAETKSLLKHVENYIEVIEIVEEISAVINLGKVKETKEIAQELRECLAANEILTVDDSEEAKFCTFTENQENLAQLLQKSLSNIQKDDLISYDNTVKDQILEVVTQLKEDLKPFATSEDPKSVDRKFDVEDTKTISENIQSEVAQKQLNQNTELHTDRSNQQISAQNLLVEKHRPETDEKLIIHQIEETISSICAISLDEIPTEIKSIYPALEHICPTLEELKLSVASLQETVLRTESPVSEMSESIVQETFSKTFHKLEENISVLNHLILESLNDTIVNENTVGVLAKPLHELHTTYQVLQENVISQYESLSSLNKSIDFAATEQILHNCYLLVQQPCEVETADEMSTLEDISCIKTTADPISPDALTVAQKKQVTTQECIEGIENSESDNITYLYEATTEIVDNNLEESTNAASELVTNEQGHAKINQSISDYSLDTSEINVSSANEQALKSEKEILEDINTKKNSSEVIDEFEGTVDDVIRKIQVSTEERIEVCEDNTTELIDQPSKTQEGVQAETDSFIEVQKANISICQAIVLEPEEAIVKNTDSKESDLNIQVCTEKYVEESDENIFEQATQEAVSEKAVVNETENTMEDYVNINRVSDTAIEPQFKQEEERSQKTLNEDMKVNKSFEIVENLSESEENISQKIKVSIEDGVEERQENISELPGQEIVSAQAEETHKTQSTLDEIIEKNITMPQQTELETKEPSLQTKESTLQETKPEKHIKVAEETTNINTPEITEQFVESEDINEKINLIYEKPNEESDKHITASEREPVKTKELSEVVGQQEQDTGLQPIETSQENTSSLLEPHKASECAEVLITQKECMELSQSNTLNIIEQPRDSNNDKHDLPQSKYSPTEESETSKSKIQDEKSNYEQKQGSNNVQDVSMKGVLESGQVENNLVEEAVTLSKDSILNQTELFVKNAETVEPNDNNTSNSTLCEINEEFNHSLIIQTMDVLLNELHESLNSTNNINAETADSLQNILDELQIQIIKLKSVNIVNANDNFNESVEDLECSVRSVQLLVSENCLANQVIEASATIKLLVSSIKENLNLISQHETPLDKTNILGDCMGDTESTLSLLDKVSESTKDHDDISTIIHDLNSVKDSMKLIKVSFSTDEETVIEQGIEIMQRLDLIEQQLFTIEGDIDRASKVDSHTRDSIITAVHSVYTNISNIRGTISNIQKRYIYENYGKPSENLLKAIKNINLIKDKDKKDNWKLLTKQFRNILNHFEEIKFYINFDKTARHPSDASFTKVVLNELRLLLDSVVLTNITELQLPLDKSIDMVIKDVEEHIRTIDKSPIIEVREKIPIFKALTEKLTEMTKEILATYESYESDLSAKLNENDSQGAVPTSSMCQHILQQAGSLEIPKPMHGEESFIQSANAPNILVTASEIETQALESSTSLNSENNEHHELIIDKVQPLIEDLIEEAMSRVLLLGMENRKPSQIEFEDDENNDDFGDKTLNELENGSITKTTFTPDNDKLNDSEANQLNLEIEKIRVYEENDANTKENIQSDTGVAKEYKDTAKQPDEDAFDNIYQSDNIENNVYQSDSCEKSKEPDLVVECKENETNQVIDSLLVSKLSEDKSEKINDDEVKRNTTINQSKDSKSVAENETPLKDKIDSSFNNEIESLNTFKGTVGQDHANCQVHEILIEDDMSEKQEEVVAGTDLIPENAQSIVKTDLDFHSQNDICSNDMTSSDKTKKNKEITNEQVAKNVKEEKVALSEIHKDDKSISQKVGENFCVDKETEWEHKKKIDLSQTSGESLEKELKTSDISSENVVEIVETADDICKIIDKELETQIEVIAQDKNIIESDIKPLNEKRKSLISCQDTDVGSKDENQTNIKKTTIEKTADGPVNQQKTAEIETQNEVILQDKNIIESDIKPLNEKSLISSPDTNVKYKDENQMTANEKPIGKTAEELVDHQKSAEIETQNEVIAQDKNIIESDVKPYNEEPNSLVSSPDINVESKDENQMTANEKPIKKTAEELIDQQKSAKIETQNKVIAQDKNIIESDIKPLNEKPKSIISSQDTNVESKDENQMNIKNTTIEKTAEGLVDQQKSAEMETQNELIAQDKSIFESDVKPLNEKPKLLVSGPDTNLESKDENRMTANEKPIKKTAEGLVDQQKSSEIETQNEVVAQDKNISESDIKPLNEKPKSLVGSPDTNVESKDENKTNIKDTTIEKAAEGLVEYQKSAEIETQNEVSAQDKNISDSGIKPFNEKPKSLISDLDTNLESKHENQTNIKDITIENAAEGLVDHQKSAKIETQNEVSAQDKNISESGIKSFNEKPKSLISGPDTNLESKDENQMNIKDTTIEKAAEELVDQLETAKTVDSYNKLNNTDGEQTLIVEKSPISSETDTSKSIEGKSEKSIESGQSITYLQNKQEQNNYSEEFLEDKDETTIEIDRQHTENKDISMATKSIIDLNKQEPCMEKNMSESELKEIIEDEKLYDTDKLSDHKSKDNFPTEKDIKILSSKPSHSTLETSAGSDTDIVDSYKTDKTDMDGNMTENNVISTQLTEPIISKEEDTSYVSIKQQNNHDNYEVDIDQSNKTDINVNNNEENASQILTPLSIKNNISNNNNESKEETKSSSELQKPSTIILSEEKDKESIDRTLQLSEMSSVSETDTKNQKTLKKSSDSKLETNGKRKSKSKKSKSNVNDIKMSNEGSSGPDFTQQLIEDNSLVKDKKTANNIESQAVATNSSSTVLEDVKHEVIKTEQLNEEFEDTGFSKKVNTIPHTARIKPQFIDTNIVTSMEFDRPPGYIPKTSQADNFSPMEVNTYSSPSNKFYKLQNLVRDNQSMTTHTSEYDSSITKDKQLRIKSLSESRSIYSEKRASDIKKKPTFTTHLTNRTAVEGSRVKLTCSVLSSTEPVLKWYKNGVLLDDKHKYKIKFNDGLITMELLNALPGDSGDYSCTVENEYGFITTSAKLKVYPSFEASPIPPTFTRSIRDVYHRAENELVLECRIRGQPLPTISWYKDNQLIVPDARFEASYLADGLCRLTINSPTKDDSGTYTCRAESAVWSDEITHVVNFADAASRLGTNISSVERLRLSHDTRRPHFTNVLSDYKVVKGGTIGLQVEIGGAPTRVEWLREGSSITELDKNAQTFVDHGIYTLALSDVSEIHSGMYTCRAWSTQGNVDMNAEIKVVQPNEADGKPPVIVSRPAKDLHISVGEDINISFRVQGEPKPKVFFMKGIRDITNSQRVCKMTSDDYVKFTVKRSVISDAGTYCILARNAYGCDRAFVTVAVRQRASSDSLISDWTYPADDPSIVATDRKYKSVPGRIPGEPSAVDGGNNWITLAWPKSDPQETSPVLAYRVDSWLLGKEGGARWVEMGITPRNTFDAFNLKQGEEYHFRVTPRNRYGWGEPVQTSNPIAVGIAGDRPEFIDILPGLLKVLVGESANLSCSFKGKPTPEIVWMKNGREIEESTKITSRQSGNVCSLTINNIDIEDEGRYSCEATNTHGRASTYARMTAITDRQIWEADAKLKRERSADATSEFSPQFTMRLRDRRVQATYPVRLTCQVIGSPTPTVTWFKDGQEVTFDSRRTEYQDEHFHTLEIAPTTLDDGGFYEALARNSCGAVSCRCNLVVDKGIRAYVAPDFCCGLEPLYRLNEGDELRVSAIVEAYPSVGVTWYRDGVRLRPSRRAIMTLDRGGQIELALASVTPRDAGVYTCTASNEVGQASTSGKVEIVTEQREERRNLPTVICPDVPYSKEPMFIKKPRSTEAQEGDTVIIECEVIGDPTPDVYWLRDFLKPDYYRDAKHFKQMAAGPLYRFEIPHAKLDYTGAYSVVARNVHGEAKAIISLQIFAKDLRSSDETHNIRYGRVEVIPRFEKELTDLLCYDGDAIEFECVVSGNPEPDIRWFHYNQILPDCPDFESTYDLGTARLKIKQVAAEDEGTYTCEASNNLGKAISTACLVVYPPGEPNTLSQRLQRPPALASAASTPRSTPRVTPARSMSRTPARSGPDTRRSRSPTREVGPKFYTYPFNKVVEEGDSVVLQCAVGGFPTPWATWDKDGIIITPSSRVSVKEKDEMLRILQIDEVNIDDVGLYRITLENEFGRAEASARLEVISHKGKFHSRSSSVSPARLFRRRTPSSSRQD